jgi:hypothetical protein
MRRATAFTAIALLLATPRFVRGQALNDDPDSPAQTQTTIPIQRRTSDIRHGTFVEPSFITKGVTLFDRRVNASSEPKDGFFPELSNMITGAGWISAGPGYRTHLFNQAGVVSASAALSVRLYRMAQVSIDFPHLATDHIRFGAQTMFRDALQVNFFGLGNDSPASARTGYRLQTNDVSTYMGVGGRALQVQARVGWLQPVKVAAMGRDADYPDTVAIFTEQQAPGLTSQSSFLHGDVSVSLDTRDSTGHATVGSFYQATWSAFADQTTGKNSFQRYEADASHYVPLGSDNWILALHGAVALSSTTAGHEVPFYLMPNLGGRNARGFNDYRFHDRNMQTYTVESRWRVFSHLDGAVFVDAGSVSPTIRQLMAFDLKPSIGVGVRLHNDKVTMARLDIGHSVEGWHVFFRMNEPFHRTTQTNGLRPVAPFVP